MGKSKFTGPHELPHQPERSSSVQGGATDHTHNQWVLIELSRLTAASAQMNERTSSQSSDITELKKDVKSLNRTIWIATGAIICAVTLATFFLGGTISDFMNSLDALKNSKG